MKTSTKNTFVKMGETAHLIAAFLFLIAGIFSGWELEGSPFTDHMERDTIAYFAMFLIMTKYAYIEGRHDACKYPNKIEKGRSLAGRILTTLLLMIVFNWSDVFGWWSIWWALMIAGSFSFVFKLRYNHVRGLDYMTTLAQRIGMIGHLVM
jgi:hypothetical protein